MKLFKLFLIALFVAFLTLIVYFSLVARGAEATVNPPTLCHHTPGNKVTKTFNNWQAYFGHIGQPHNGSTYDTQGACVEPSVTPTLTPTPIPEEECKDCEPEVTPIPEVTPEPEGRVESTPAGAPTCDGVPFVKLPANVHVIRNGDTAEVKWTPTQGTQAEIYYYENQNVDNKHSVKDTYNDGHEVIGLLGSKDWTFGLQQKDGCAFSGTVYIVDGNTPRLFRFLYAW